ILRPGSNACVSMFFVRARSSSSIVDPLLALLEGSSPSCHDNHRLGSPTLRGELPDTVPQLVIEVLVDGLRQGKGIPRGRAVRRCHALRRGAFRAPCTHDLPKESPCTVPQSTNDKVWKDRIAMNFQQLEPAGLEQRRDGLPPDE